MKSLGYRVEPWPQGGMNYAVYNYSNPTVGPLFKQLYIRQAIQALVDQPAYIESLCTAMGYRLMARCRSSRSSRFQRPPRRGSPQQNNPVSLQHSNAKSLLKSHGWKIIADGVDTCQKPGTATTSAAQGSQREAAELPVPVRQRRDPVPGGDSSAR